MKLLRFGFFDDLPVEQRHNAIKQLCSVQGSNPDAGKILNYLKAGVPLMLIAGVTRDWLSPNQEIIGPPHILTDGAWAWTADVRYYVERYHLALPESFTAHMRSNRWEVRSVPDLGRLEF